MRKQQKSTPDITPSKPSKLKFMPVFVGALVVIAGLLVFSPSLFIQTSVQSVNSRSIESSNASQNAEDSQKTRSTPIVNNTDNIQQTPYETALSQQARGESQTLLAQLLANIKTLKALSVDEWNSEAMSQIEALASKGDERYAQNQYSDALDHYSQALNASEQLLESRDTIAKGLIQTGKTALEKGMVQKAQSDFDLALLLTPDSDDIQSLINQASVRDKVFALDLSAENNLRKNDLLAAKKDYLAIQKLDPLYNNISEKVSQLNQQIVEQNFKQAMSSGFTYLANNQLTQAETAFNQALEFKPKSSAVIDALAQVEAGRIASLKQDSIDKAIAYEKSEKWQSALKLYNELLDEDPSLVSAKIGKIRAGARASLHTQIIQVLDDPLKLQQEEAWRSANSILNDARSVIDRGPLLSSQIEQLETVITRARTKITLALLSDNQTEVEIYRISKLGTFKEHAVALNPGRYVVVGKRNGYRDIRENVVIDGFNAEIQLSIACSERI